jgi:flagellar protein FliL
MKKLLIFILLPLILLIGAGIGAIFFGLVPGVGPGMLGMGGHAEPEKPKTDEPPPPYRASATIPSFYTLPEFVVNLQSDRRIPVFLLVSVSLELDNEGSQPVIKALEPRIVDSVIVYLSSLTPADLSGYDGIQRVRAEVWRRVRKIADPKMIMNLQINKMTVK